MSARLVLVLSASVASALTLGVSPVNKMVPVSPLHRASLAMAEPTVAEEEADKTLITLDAISDNYRMQVENALMLRNKERIMSGMPKYESIEAMVSCSFSRLVLAPPALNTPHVTPTRESAGAVPFQTAAFRAASADRKKRP